VKRALVLAGTHAVALAVGVALGIYLLPILVAPDGPTAGDVAARAAPGPGVFTATFRRDLKDSDALHWGEGTVTVSPRAITLLGSLAPGPDYKLYLSPEFVETEADFARMKPRMVRVGDVKTFDNFVLDVPPAVDVSQYRAVVVWCEAFSQFITAAAYR
jgi:hypothetical protein